MMLPKMMVVSPALFEELKRHAEPAPAEPVPVLLGFEVRAVPMIQTEPIPATRREQRRRMMINRRRKRAGWPPIQWVHEVPAKKVMLVPVDNAPPRLDTLGYNFRIGAVTGARTPQVELSGISRSIPIACA